MPPQPRQEVVGCLVAVWVQSATCGEEKAFDLRSILFEFIRKRADIQNLRWPVKNRVAGGDRQCPKESILDVGRVGQGVRRLLIVEPVARRLRVVRRRLGVRPWKDQQETRAQRLEQRVQRPVGAGGRVQSGELLFQPSGELFLDDGGGLFTQRKEVGGGPQ